MYVNLSLLPKKFNHWTLVSVSLEDERREVFTEATMRQAHQMRMPVTLEVGSSHIRITSVSAIVTVKLFLKIICV